MEGIVKIYSCCYSTAWYDNYLIFFHKNTGMTGEKLKKFLQIFTYNIVVDIYNFS